MTEITDILGKGNSNEEKNRLNSSKYNSYFDRNKEKVPKDIEELLVEKGFKKEKRPYWDDRGIYVRDINSKKEVFVYSGGDMILTKIPKNRGVEKGLKKIRNYEDQSEYFMDKWVTPFMFLAPYAGFMVMMGKVFWTDKSLIKIMVNV